MTTRDKLAALAGNMWWSWNPDAIALFRRLNPSVFDAMNNNPVAAYRYADDEVLASASFSDDVDRVYEAFRAYMDADRRFADAPKTAYYCMEYGLHESLPLYAGGLGILAGDHAKAASDLGLDFTAIGFLLRDGYFKQFFEGDGWQQAEYPSIDPTLHALEKVRGEDGKPLTVTVHLGYHPLHVQAWKLPLGRTTMYLLDTDFDANPYELRFLTHRLYQGSGRTRLHQEIILGIGGTRLLRALGITPEVYHMNEGHCAFLTFELMRERIHDGMPREEAEQWVRDRAVFTTHTPVMAGHDRFDAGLFNSEMETIRQELGVTHDDLLGYGRVNPYDVTESFTMTVLGLKMSRAANGVSQLNGEVSRRQWHHLYQDLAVEKVPIGAITNGVHLPTWTAPSAHAFLGEHLGDDWLDRRHEQSLWDQIREIPDETLWQYRSALRRELIDYVNERLPHQSLPMTSKLDPDALTIGFARRFAPYKRATLLFHDLERAIDLFNQDGRPVQILFAGKSHPANDDGKLLIQRIIELARHPKLEGKVVFVENYNMEVGRMLVSGCDVWLNNPRRPHEASGTSGQKVSIHGGLNVSILDGWWPEGYDGKNGWAIGHEASADYKDPQTQDREDAQFLYDVVKDEVVPTFYDRDADGLPRQWIAMMREVMTDLPRAFSAERMLQDYIEQMYGSSKVVPV